MRMYFKLTSRCFRQYVCVTQGEYKPVGLNYVFRLEEVFGKFLYASFLLAEVRVNVEVECSRYVGMTEQVTERLDVTAVFYATRGKGVPQAVEGDAWQSQPAEKPVEIIAVGTRLLPCQ